MLLRLDFSKVQFSFQQYLVLRLKALINNKPITISLFAGAYGLDLGLEKAGIQTVSLVKSNQMLPKLSL